MNLTPTQSTTRAIGTELVDAELPGRIFRRHGAFQPSLQRKPITTSVISIPAEPSHGPVPESPAARSTTTTTTTRATRLVALELPGDACDADVIAPDFYERCTAGIEAR